MRNKEAAEELRRIADIVENHEGGTYSATVKEVFNEYPFGESGDAIRVRTDFCMVIEYIADESGSKSPFEGALK